MYAIMLVDACARNLRWKILAPERYRMQLQGDLVWTCTAEGEDCEENAECCTGKCDAHRWCHCMDKGELAWAVCNAAVAHPVPMMHLAT